jgi:acetyl esterase/lipase
MISPYIHRILFAVALLLGFYEHVPAETQPFSIVPTTVSPVAKAFLRTATPFTVSAETLAQWKQVRSEFRDQLQEYSNAAKAKFVRETETRDMAGVPVLVVTPKSYSKKNDKRIVIYIHGGAYTLGRPAELYHVFAPMASATGMKVFAIDYRLAPEHPFPASLNVPFGDIKSLAFRRRKGIESVR